MLVLTGATGKITAVTVCKKNIVTAHANTQKMHLFTGAGSDFAGGKGLPAAWTQQELQLTWQRAAAETQQSRSLICLKT